MNFFPSFSIIINGLIIFIFKIFKRKRSTKAGGVKTVILSYFIILLLSSSMIASFIYLIRASLKKDTNLDTIVAVSKKIEFSTPLEAADSTDLKQGRQLDCLADFQTKQHQADTIYNLLASNGLDPSYKSRLTLAASLKLPEYSGTSRQNKQLLSLLEKNDNLARLYCQLPLLN